MIVKPNLASYSAHSTTSALVIILLMSHYNWKTKTKMSHI